MSRKADDSIRTGEENNMPSRNGWDYRSINLEFEILRQIFTQKKSFILPFIIVFWIG
jgi:hypothetical protein